MPFDRSSLISGHSGAARVLYATNRIQSFTLQITDVKRAEHDEREALLEARVNLLVSG
jgi:hypothetical protein